MKFLLAFSILITPYFKNDEFFVKGYPVQEKQAKGLKDLINGYLSFKLTIEDERKNETNNNTQENWRRVAENAEKRNDTKNETEHTKNEDLQKSDVLNIKTTKESEKENDKKNAREDIESKNKIISKEKIYDMGLDINNATRNVSVIDGKEQEQENKINTESNTFGNESNSTAQIEVIDKNYLLNKDVSDTDIKKSENLKEEEKEMELNIEKTEISEKEIQNQDLKKEKGNVNETIGYKENNKSPNIKFRDKNYTHQIIQLRNKSFNENTYNESRDKEYKTDDIKESEIQISGDIGNTNNITENDKQYKSINMKDDLLVNMDISKEVLYADIINNKAEKRDNNYNEKKHDEIDKKEPIKQEDDLLQKPNNGTLKNIEHLNTGIKEPTNENRDGGIDGDKILPNEIEELIKEWNSEKIEDEVKKLKNVQGSQEKRNGKDISGEQNSQTLDERERNVKVKVEQDEKGVIYTDEMHNTKNKSEEEDVIKTLKDNEGINNNGKVDKIEENKEKVMHNKGETVNGAKLLNEENQEKTQELMKKIEKVINRGEMIDNEDNKTEKINENNRGGAIEKHDNINVKTEELEHEKVNLKEILGVPENKIAVDRKPNIKEDDFLSQLFASLFKGNGKTDNKSTNVISQLLAILGEITRAHITDKNNISTKTVDHHENLHRVGNLEESKIVMKDNEKHIFIQNYFLSQLFAALFRTYKPIYFKAKTESEPENVISRLLSILGELIRKETTDINSENDEETECDTKFYQHCNEKRQQEREECDETIYEKPTCVQVMKTRVISKTRPKSYTYVEENGPLEACKRCICDCNEKEGRKHSKSAILGECECSCNCEKKHLIERTKQRGSNNMDELNKLERDIDNKMEKPKSIMRQRGEQTRTRENNLNEGEYNFDSKSVIKQKNDKHHITRHLKPDYESTSDSKSDSDGRNYRKPTNSEHFSDGEIGSAIDSEWEKIYNKHTVSKDGISEEKQKEAVENHDNNRYSKYGRSEMKHYGEKYVSQSQKEIASLRNIFLESDEEKERQNKSNSADENIEKDGESELESDNTKEKNSENESESEREMHRHLSGRGGVGHKIIVRDRISSREIGSDIDPEWKKIYNKRTVSKGSASEEKEEVALETHNNNRNNDYDNSEITQEIEEYVSQSQNENARHRIFFFESDEENGSHNQNNNANEKNEKHSESELESDDTRVKKSENEKDLEREMNWHLSGKEAVGHQIIVRDRVSSREIGSDIDSEWRRIYNKHIVSNSGASEDRERDAVKHNNKNRDYGRSEIKQEREEYLSQNQKAKAKPRNFFRQHINNNDSKNIENNTESELESDDTKENKNENERSSNREVNRNGPERSVRGNKTIVRNINYSRRRAGKRKRNEITEREQRRQREKVNRRVIERDNTQSDREESSKERGRHDGGRQNERNVEWNEPKTSSEVVERGERRRNKDRRRTYGERDREQNSASAINERRSDSKEHDRMHDELRKNTESNIEPAWDKKETKIQRQREETDNGRNFEDKMAFVAENRVKTDRERAIARARERLVEWKRKKHQAEFNNEDHTNTKRTTKINDENKSHESFNSRRSNKNYLISRGMKRNYQPSILPLLVPEPDY